MSYLVLARKYRPQRFADLVGQEHVARTLTNAIQQNRVHHAFLFTGARGVGKTSAARILAKALCCETGPTAEPCGVCEQCQEIASGRSVDVIEIDAASNTKVEETKSILEGVRYAPVRARRKVYIIDEVHMLSTHSFNALLKTLEEPPPHVVFIFATTEVHKIPVTILSRTQRFDFKLISTARLTAHLAGVLKTEKIAADDDAVRVIARQAAGSVRDGLSLLDQAIAYVGDATLTRATVADVLGVADRRLLVEVAGHMLARDAGATLRALARAVDGGIDLGQLARAFLGFLRDLEIVARVKDAADLPFLIDATPDELAEVQALVAKAPPGLFGVLFDRWARLVDEAAASQTPRLLVEMAAVELCAAEPLVPIGDLLDRLDELEGRLSGGAPAGPRTGGGGGGASPSPRGAAPTPTGGPRSWAAPPSAAPPSPPAVASPPPPVASSPASAPSAPVAAPAPRAASLSPSDAWRVVLASFESKPVLGMRLANANVKSFEAGTLTLAFADRFDVDKVEKARKDIEDAVAAVMGQPTKVVFVVGAASTPSLVKSEVGSDLDAVAAERKNREVEARKHPLIQKAQDVFNSSLKEIKPLDRGPN
ncbi:MAG TPA: DNA polymerase III subunit gamma/tau [Polyangia bacterium]|jgi:DNA polymerase-3 subunit gamma/tau|nr:DNA polymerase III subunit gamma/tau [Polyangia bacterium]